MARFEALTADWLSLDEALRRSLARAAPLPSVHVPLDDALHRVLSGTVRARVTLPPCDNSAMDGYAVRGDDISEASEAEPVWLRVVGAVLAGGSPELEVGAGGAVRIMTGAPIPPGADSVVRVEDTDAESEQEGRVRVSAARDRGRNIRPAGRDFREDDVIIQAGTSITPGWSAVLAAGGHGGAHVHRRPRVAVLACGDELRSPGEIDDVRAGIAVPESNGIMIAAAVRACGGVPVRVAIARDDPADLRARVAEVADADVLVTLGGASMGEADLLKRTLLEDGLELDFWRVRVRPGSPVSLGHLPRPGAVPPLPVFGLPGNPASAFVTFQLLVRPFLRRLLGDPAPHRPVVRAVAGEHLSSAAPLCHLHRVTLDGDPGQWTAYLAGPQGSGLVSSLGPAAGLGVIPEGRSEIAAGEPLDVLLLDDRLPGRADPGYRCLVDSA